MFGLSSNTRVYLRTGFTDGRLGYEGLRGLVGKVIHEDARGGHLFVFCNKRANRVKLLWYHEGGFYVAAKRLDRGAVDWPRTEAGAASMSPAQLLVLLRGVEFTRPHRGYRR